MKAKLLLILLSALFIVPINASTAKKGKRKSHMRHFVISKRMQTRSLYEFSMTTQDEENTLIVLFQTPLNDAEITVTDKDGNIVIYESQTSIYEGKTLNIFTPNAYPYKVEITSPSMDVTGEIIQEEF